LGCCGGYAGLRPFRHRGLLRSTCALPSRRAITRLICGTALTPYIFETPIATAHSPSRYTSAAMLAASPHPLHGVLALNHPQASAPASPGWFAWGLITFLSTILATYFKKPPKRLSNGNESLINRPNHSLIGTGPGWVGPGVNSHAAHQGQRQACSSNPRASSPPSAQPHPSRAGAGQPGVLQQSGLIVGDFYLVVS